VAVGLRRRAAVLRGRAEEGTCWSAQSCCWGTGAAPGVLRVLQGTTGVLPQGRQPRRGWPRGGDDTSQDGPTCAILVRTAPPLCDTGQDGPTCAILVRTAPPDGSAALRGATLPLFHHVMLWSLLHAPAREQRKAKQTIQRSQPTSKHKQS
jgi:hypothetical protein